MNVPKSGDEDPVPPEEYASQGMGSSVSKPHHHRTTSAGSQEPDLRRGVRADIADPKQVVASTDDPGDDDNMSKAVPRKIRAVDLYRVFTHDDDFILVSPEQLQRVKKMHARMDEGASFSFNYNTLLLVASVIAGLGLASNSSTTIIASMLVSPIMGPVVGLAYGTAIRDWKLVRKSSFTEGISIIFCIIMGLIIAACCGPTELSESWPTDEMLSRATLQNLYVSLPIAFFSGLGVAVSLLDEQTSSLVGVAISASLLPPAVNCGLLWVSYVFFERGSGHVAQQYCTYYNDHENCSEDFLDQFNTGGFSADDVVTKFRNAGLVSLILTLANIVLIWFSSLLMFRMKERLPIKKKVFWEDLGVARKVYKRKAVISRNRAFETTDKKGENEDHAIVNDFAEPEQNIVL